MTLNCKQTRAPSVSCAMFVSALIFVGCNSTAPRYTKDVNDEAEMRSVVLNHVPLGASAEWAQEFMESEGFEYEYSRDGVYVQPKDGSEGKYYSREDVVGAIERGEFYLRDLQATHDIRQRSKLYFQRHDQCEGAFWSFLVSTVRDVSIETSDDVVIDVQASQWMLGP